MTLLGFRGHPEARFELEVFDGRASEWSGGQVAVLDGRYKRQVVDLVTSTGRTASSVAAEVGLHHTLVSRWIRRYGRSSKADVALVPRPVASSLKPVSIATADQAAEIARLRRENERLRMERDILRKGIAIFAVPLR